jgi:hypothetical protein
MIKRIKKQVEAENYRFTIHDEWEADFKRRIKKS